MPSDVSGNWAIRLASHAAKDLTRVFAQSRELHDLLVEDIKHLSTNPFPAPPKGKKLRGLNGVFWRLRVGAYRVLYRPLEPHTLLILRIIPRRELERVLKTL